MQGFLKVAPVLVLASVVAGWQAQPSATPKNSNPPSTTNPATSTTAPSSRPVIPRRFGQGAKVEIDEHGTGNWRPGTVRRAGRYHYYVNFDGWSEFFNKWIPDERVRARDPNKQYPPAPPQNNGSGNGRPIPPEPPAPAPKPVEVARDPDPTPPTAATPSTQNTPGQDAPSPEVATTDAAREGVRIVDYRAAEVEFKPDGLEYPRPPVKAIDLRPYENSNARKLNPAAILPGAEGREVIVVSHEGLTADNKKFFRLEILDIAQGRALGTADLLPGVIPIGVSKDGKRVAAKILNDRNTAKVLAVYELKPGVARQLGAFAPFQGEKGDGSVLFAVPLDDTRVFAFGNRGEVGVYEVTPGRRPEDAKVRAIWESPNKGPAQPTALSPNLDYIAIPRDGGVSIIRASDGLCAARIPKAQGFLCFSPKGDRLAAVNGYILSVFDIASGKRIQNALTALEIKPIEYNPFWLTNDLIFLNGQTVVDVNLGLPVWRLKMPETPSGLMLGWFVSLYPPVDVRAKAKFRAAPPPLAEMQAAAAKLKDADAFDFRPGDVVKLEISAPDDQIRARIEATLRKQLAAVGVNINPFGRSTIRASVTAGPSRTQKYRNFRTGEDREVSIPSRIAKFEWEVNGRIVYSASQPFEAYTSMVDTSRGQSIEEAIQKNMPTCESFFDRSFPIDLVVPKPEYVKPAEETTLP